VTDLADRIDEIRANAVTIVFDGQLGRIDPETAPRLDGEEAVAVCPECEALIWIAEPANDGELFLMRICEVMTEHCETCTRARAAVHDPELEDVIKEALEDD